MSKLIRSFVARIVLPILTGMMLTAAGRDSWPRDWESVRKTQPKGLLVTMELPKNRFFLGERIDAKITFSNDGAAPFYVWTATWDRSGRLPDIAFYAKDQSNAGVVDPWEGLFAGGRGGGFGRTEDLGSWSITLPVNEWLRFEKPGQYQIYVWASKVRQGQRPEYTSRSDPLITPVVSALTAITIDPITAEQENQTITDCLHELAGTGEARERAIHTLGYLGTAGAHRELIKLLNSEQKAFLALKQSSHPQEVANEILDQVSIGKLAPTRQSIGCYAELRARGVNYRKNEPKWRQIYKEAEGEIANAARLIISAESPIGSLADLVLVLPSDHGLRSALVARQLELSGDAAYALISRFPSDARARQEWMRDFLPIIRMRSVSPHYDKRFLVWYAEVRPAEAKQVFLEDLKSEVPQYPENGDFGKIFEAFPQKQIPEVEEILLRKLRAGDAVAALLMPLVERYCSETILSDVIGFYEDYRGEWRSDRQSALLRYWLRNDREGAIKALAAAARIKDESNCYAALLTGTLLEQEWIPSTWPVLEAGLNDSDPSVVDSAIQVIAKRGPAAALDAAFAAAMRLSLGVKNTMDPESRSELQSKIRSIAKRLSQARWKPTPAQSMQLKEWMAE